MEANVIEFLEGFTAEELERRGILIGKDRFLRAQSVEPLIKLMEENDASRLVEQSRMWFLTSEGEFSNPLSEEDKAGKYDDLQKWGNVFNQQNTYINPHCPRFKGNPDGDNELREGYTFGLERDLQRALRANIEQLEPGLAIVDGGTEKSVATGRIDITAEDSQGNLVIIELKAAKAPDSALTQLLGYMGSIESPEAVKIRGILVAEEFSDRLISAAKLVPDISLKAYSIRFTFHDS